MSVEGSDSSSRARKLIQSVIVPSHHQGCFQPKCCSRSCSSAAACFWLESSDAANFLICSAAFACVFPSFLSSRSASINCLVADTTLGPFASIVTRPSTDAGTADFENSSP